jgi:hypothetical protein
MFVSPLQRAKDSFLSLAKAGRTNPGAIRLPHG